MRQELTLDSLRGLSLGERCLAAQQAMAEIYSSVTQEPIVESRIIAQAKRVEKELLSHATPEKIEAMFEAHFVVVFDPVKRQDILTFLKEQAS
jgi:hypothetical protein